MPTISEQVAGLLTEAVRDKAVVMNGGHRLKTLKLLVRFNKQSGLPEEEVEVSVDFFGRGKPRFVTTQGPRR